MSPGSKHPIVVASPSATAPDRKMSGVPGEQLEMPYQIWEENKGNYSILEL